MNKIIKKIFRLRDKNDSRVEICIHDQVVLPSESTRVLTTEGYLKATAAITQVGVQMYPACDFGGDSDEPVGLYRTRETVFHPETIESVKLKPIVLLHPEEGDVSAENHSRLAVGTVGETVEEIPDERLGAAIQITDAPTVKKVLAREVEELSLGYDTFIISEEGSFNGQKYFYKTDGPMINNHLAIVPKGRCGDTVKILDKGVDKVDKQQALKRLRDAGVPENKIKSFMASAKDSDPVDFDEYTKILLGLKDIDMAALVPGIIAELKPNLEEMVASPEFSTMLAKEIAAGMAGGTPPVEGDTDTDAEEVPEKKPEIDPEKMDAAIKDAAQKRSLLLDMASPFLKKKEGFDKFAATDREILETALEAAGIKLEDIKDKKDDYLAGILDSISQDRRDVENISIHNIDSDSPEALAAPMTGIGARKKLKD